MKSLPMFVCFFLFCFVFFLKNNKLCTSSSFPLFYCVSYSCAGALSSSLSRLLTPRCQADCCYNQFRCQYSHINLTVGRLLSRGGGTHSHWKVVWGCAALKTTQLRGPTLLRPVSAPILTKFVAPDTHILARIYSRDPSFLVKNQFRRTYF